MKKFADNIDATSTNQKLTFLFLLTYILLCVDAFGGALRYYFSLFNIESLLYIPKLLALVISVFPFYIYNTTRRVGNYNFGVLLVYFVLALSIWVAIYNSVAYSAIAFMFLILAPFILGLRLPVPNNDQQKIILIFLFILWIITIGGIWADYFIDFPWKGGEYELYGKTIELSRSWTTIGIEMERPAGFTRMSGTASVYTGALGIILLIHSRNIIIKILLIFITISTLIITTTKSAIFAAIAVLLFLLFRPFVFMRIAILTLSLVFAIYLPLSSFSKNHEISFDNEVSNMIFYSFDDRLSNTWPNYYSAITHSFIGEGFGGVGTANNMYGSQLANQTLSIADNFLLYLIGWFGFIFGICIFIWLGYSAYRFSSSKNRWYEAIGIAGIFILLVGITADVIETVSGGLLLGIIAVGFKDS